MWRSRASCSSDSCILLWCLAFPKATPETEQEIGLASRPAGSVSSLFQRAVAPPGTQTRSESCSSFVILLKVSVRLLSHVFAHIPLGLLQALIYPLTVASKSTTTARHNAANKILKNMCEHSNTLVQQAMMVSQEQCGLPLFIFLVTVLHAPSGCQKEHLLFLRDILSFLNLWSSLHFGIQVSEELIRVAILWHEMWHEGLEEASRLYFGERNVKGMFEVLEPLHAMMERGPQTLKETSFNQVRGRKA